MKSEKGFTLIELLVVVAIIGILAAVVLISLGSARGKSQLARYKSQLKQIPTAAETYVDAEGDYGNTTTVCGTTANGYLFADKTTAGALVNTGIKRLLLAANYGGTNATVTCKATANTYAVGINFTNALNGVTGICIDSATSTVQEKTSGTFVVTSNACA